MTKHKFDEDDLTTQQIFEVEMAAGAKFREISFTDAINMAVPAWLALLEQGQKVRFAEVFAKPPAELSRILEEHYGDDEDEAGDTPNPSEPQPSELPPPPSLTTD